MRDAAARDHVRDAHWTCSVSLGEGRQSGREKSASTSEGSEPGEGRQKLVSQPDCATRHDAAAAAATDDQDRERRTVVGVVDEGAVGESRWQSVLEIRLENSNRSCASRHAPITLIPRLSVFPMCSCCNPTLPTPALPSSRDQLMRATHLTPLPPPPPRDPATTPVDSQTHDCEIKDQHSSSSSSSGE